MQSNYITRQAMQYAQAAQNNNFRRQYTYDSARTVTFPMSVKFNLPGVDTSKLDDYYKKPAGWNAATFLIQLPISNVGLAAEVRRKNNSLKKFLAF
jgi:hypothetical protein